MKYYIVIFLAHLSFILYSQDRQAVKYGKTITVSDLKEHLYVIASDSMEGRETGEIGQKKAAKYIADYFENIGLAKL